MQFEGHAYTWGHDPIQQVHVCEHPFISGRCDAKIPLEKGMEAVEKRFQAVIETNNRNEPFGVFFVKIYQTYQHHTFYNSL